MTTFNDINKRTGLLGIGNIPGLAPVAAFNPNQIENLLRTKGILAFHVKHAISHTKETLQAGANVNRDGAERPFQYYDIRPILMIPQQLNFQDTLTQINLNGTGTAVFNVSGTYIDANGGRVYVRVNDLILPNPELTDLHEELIQYRGESPLKLSYRVKSVDYLACVSQGRLEEQVDFTVDASGQILFTPGKKQPKLNETVSVVYYTTPIYSVQHVPHSLRILPGNPSGDGRMERTAYYGPQMVIVHRSMVRDDSMDWFGILEDLDWRQYLTSG